MSRTDTCRFPRARSGAGDRESYSRFQAGDLDLARQRFAQGLTSELDVRQFEAQVAAPAVTIAQTERLQSQQEHSLSALLGERAARASTLSASLLARRPDVQQAERAFAAATARIGATMASNLPAITIIGSYGSQAGTPSTLFTPGTTVYQLSAGFSFPLSSFTRSATKAAAARARAPIRRRPDMRTPR